MINLLPDDAKRDIRAARMNVALLRYNFLTIIAIAALSGLCFLFYVIMQNSQLTALETNNTNTTKANNFSAVRKAADDYRNNLSIASKILDNGVNYTAVIFAITKLLPEGVVLDGLNLTASNFGQQTSFVAHAKTYDQATKLKENFQTSTLFSNVYFQSLTDSETAAQGEGKTAYPIAVTISAKLNKVVN